MQDMARSRLDTIATLTETPSIGGVAVRPASARRASALTTASGWAISQDTHNPLSVGRVGPPHNRRPADPALRGGPFLHAVDLVGALACPLAAGAGAVPGGVQLVGHLRP